MTRTHSCLERHPEDGGAARIAVLEERAYESAIDSETGVRIGWVEDTDFLKVYGKEEKEPKHVQ